MSSQALGRGLGRRRLSFLIVSITVSLSEAGVPDTATLSGGLCV